MKLQELARNAPGVIERLVRYLETQEGTRGRRVLGDLSAFAIVTDDGTWTQLRMPREPEITGVLPKLRKAGSGSV